MEIISTREAARILECSTEYVAKLLRDKRLKGQKMNRTQWVVDKNSVLKFQKEREITKYQKRLVK